MTLIAFEIYGTQKSGDSMNAKNVCLNRIPDRCTKSLRNFSDIEKEYFFLSLFVKASQSGLLGSLF